LKVGDDVLNDPIQETFDMPDTNAKATKKAVEQLFEKYRIFKYLSFEEREAVTTAPYGERTGGNTNVTSDQTAQIAVHNADEAMLRKRFCERVEWAVRRLPAKERFLIEERYMTSEYNYVNDILVYCFSFKPPISKTTYDKYRWFAFYKLAFALGVAVLEKQK
jgi:ArpU family phage transcriptional regulator